MRSKSLCPSIGLLFAVAFFALPFFSHAAELSFSPASGSHAVNAEFSVKVSLAPGGESVNAADGTVAFDRDLLSVSSISKDGSAFSLWTAEPAFSNSAGTVTFSGGTPTAFSNSATVITINFKGKKAGSAKLSFSKGSILAADGKGTDVYAKGGEATFTITEAAAAPEPEPEAEAPAAAGDENTGPPAAPAITSKTHQKPENWYGTSTAEFSWKPGGDITNVRTILSDKEDAVPTEEQDVAVISRTIPDIKDGVWYFFLQFKNDSGWGQVGKMKIQIDSVPPPEFEVSLQAGEGEVPRLVFKVEDELSGIDRYEVVIGGAVLATVKAEEVTDGTYPVPPQGGGPQVVQIKAYDKAGNMREAKKDLDLPKVNKPNPRAAEEEQESPPFFTLDRIFTILFAILTGALGTMNFYTRKGVQEERLQILKRLSEVADKNDKVFSAMREEFEEMIDHLDEKPQLTPQEREFLEKVKEVLDISEELVDTGMEDVKKTVRGQ